MTYSLNQITTKADCDALIALANIDLDMLNHSRYMENRQYGTVSAGAASIDAELQAVIAEKTGLESILATLPDGPSKAQMDTRIFKLGYKKRLLEERRGKTGSLALLQKEYALSCIDKEIAENDSYITALKSRKDEL